MIIIWKKYKEIILLMIAAGVAYGTQQTTISDNKERSIENEHSLRRVEISLERMETNMRNNTELLKEVREDVKKINK